jgi:putative ABC transport system ATP-binding protein
MIMNNANLLETINLRKTYKVGRIQVEALRGVNLKVRRGEMVAIMGPSGCGKSTLMQILGAISRPTHGTVFIDGHSTSDMTDRQLTHVRRSKIGFVFQRFNLLPTLTAQDNIEVARYLHQRHRARLDPHTGQIVQLLKIEDKMGHKPSELSGGEQQRVAIARAVANKPSILLADEPTGSLDSQNSSLVLKMLCALNRKFKQTIILVTHNPELARHAERVVEMRDGEIVQDVKASDLK